MDKELKDFVEWCIKHGHYQGPPLVQNYWLNKQRQEEKKLEAFLDKK